MADEKNQLNGWVLFVAPIFVFVAIYQLIPAISDRLITDWVGLVIYLAVSVLIGFFLFRNSRTIRDHEWHRSKHIKRLQKNYAAEDRGVWSKADLAMAGLEADAQGIEMGQMSQKALQRLDGSIGGLTGDRLTSEIESKDTDHESVALFSESEHVRRSTARVTGEGDPVEFVQGVTHARETSEKGLIGGVLDKLKATSVQPSATIEPTSLQEPELAADDWYAQEMHGVATAGPSSATSAPVGNTCGSCGLGNLESEAYCENCGNKL
jgi:hypothetical protein